MTTPSIPQDQFASSHCVVECRMEGDETVLAVRGELDLASQELLVSAAAAATTHVTVDLGATDFLDGAGIRALVQAAEECGRRGGRLRIVHPRPFQRKLLEQLDLTGMLAQPLDPSKERESLS